MRLLLFFLATLMMSIPMSNAATTSFTCSFPLSASPSGLKRQANGFELRFVSDDQTNKAYLLGNNGSAEVTPIEKQGGGISFVEVTASGNVMVTAITASGEAVHSRNGIMSGKLIPSQYYGKCTLQ